MRVTGGQFLGRIIKGSPGSHVRPSTDRTRESFFNIINNQFNYEELNVLDLFSGTGIMGLEFLSRGCEHLTSVDINAKSVFFIKNIISEFDLKEKWIAVKKDSVNFIQNNDLNNFNLIFADPPYDWKFYHKFVDLCLEKISSGTMLCVEHEKNLIFNNPELKQTKIYGQSAISFFIK